MAERAERVGTVVIGAGQAGLANSYALTRRGLDHVVLERGRIGEPWQCRWDSLCMILPNWFNRLPGFPYQGSQPDGFQTRDEWVADLGRYAAGFALPVRHGVAVTAVRQRRDGRFSLQTSAGALAAENVVVATGSYQAPRVPAVAAGLAGDIHQVHSGGYRNPDALPPEPSSSSARATPAARSPRSSTAPAGRSPSPWGKAASRSAGIGVGTCSDGSSPRSSTSSGAMAGARGGSATSPDATAGAPSTSTASPTTASASWGGSGPSTAPPSRWPRTCPRVWPRSIAAPTPSAARSMPSSTRTGSTRRPTNRCPTPRSAPPR